MHVKKNLALLACSPLALQSVNSSLVAWILLLQVEELANEMTQLSWFFSFVHLIVCNKLQMSLFACNKAKLNCWNKIYAKRHNHCHFSGAPMQLQTISLYLESLLNYICEFISFVRFVRAFIRIRLSHHCALTSKWAFWWSWTGNHMLWFGDVI